MLDWLIKNKEWVFSGVGVAIIGVIIALVRWLLRRKSPTDDLARAELQQRRQASLPFFRWRDGSTDHVIRICKFENLGGTVSSLTVQTDAPLDVTINPADRLLSQRQGFVRFAARSTRISNPFEFAIRYNTEFNESKTERFRIDAHDREPTGVQ